MARIAFIGLGNMGRPMAANLVNAGHEVRGLDLVPAANEAAASVGVHITDSAAVALTDAELVITMLPAGGDVLKAYRSDLLPAARPGTLFIDCSTIDVASARTAHEAAMAA